MGWPEIADEVMHTLACRATEDQRANAGRGTLLCEVGFSKNDVYAHVGRGQLPGVDLNGDLHWLSRLRLTPCGIFSCVIFYRKDLHGRPS